MDKRVRLPSGQQRTTIFTRIILRLCFPLLLLGVLFAGLQLTSQVYILNEFHRIRGQLIFEQIYQDLSKLITTAGSTQGDLAPIEKTIRDFENSSEIEKIELFDLLERKPLLGASIEDWTAFDFRAMEESLYNKKIGKPYLVKINKAFQEMIAYIPLQGPQTDQFFIARVSVSLSDLHDALAISKWRLIVMFVLIIITGIIISLSLTRAIVKPLKRLMEATQELVRGKLGKHVHITTGDEIEVLAQAFNQMSDTIKNMREQAQDANPLTQLPGNQGIFFEIRKRIHERQKCVLFHADIDRFKLFNDHFGLARGDQVIKLTAEVLKKAVREKGRPDDFIGHQGGDDFIIITKPQYAKEVGENICRLFDLEVRREVYRKEDLEKGFTLQLDRRRMAETGEEITRKFPLISISLAGISNTKKDFADYFDCMSSAAIVKKEAKKITESICIIRN
ncbi:diguanylate cyclase [Omnitrophica bacterium]|nr:diguanylate cyclase [Candidatus Omnitrophota bacterium]